MLLRAYAAMGRNLKMALAFGPGGEKKPRVTLRMAMAMAAIMRGFMRG
jgi:hypothetical protein